MSDIAINQVLAQMRAMQALLGRSKARKTRAEEALRFRTNVLPHLPIRRVLSRL